MEKFFIPKDKIKFTKWLLQLSIESDLTVVFEYSEHKLLDFISHCGTQVTLPKSAGHNYHESCKLTAMTKPTLTDSFVDALINCCHVLSIHNIDKMIFLIADDFDEECFSCTAEFYKKYYKTLDEQNLIDEDYDTKHST